MTTVDLATSRKGQKSIGARLRDCYRNAFMLTYLSDDNNLYYCEGHAVSDLIPCPIAHAFIYNAVDNTFIDPTYILLQDYHETSHEYFTGRMFSTEQCNEMLADGLRGSPDAKLKLPRTGEIYTHSYGMQLATAMAWKCVTDKNPDIQFPPGFLRRALHRTGDDFIEDMIDMGYAYTGLHAGMPSFVDSDGKTYPNMTGFHPPDIIVAGIYGGQLSIGAFRELSYYQSPMANAVSPAERGFREPREQEVTLYDIAYEAYELGS